MGEAGLARGVQPVERVVAVGPGARGVGDVGDAGDAEGVVVAVGLESGAVGIVELSELAVGVEVARGVD